MSEPDSTQIIPITPSTAPACPFFDPFFLSQFLRHTLMGHRQLVPLYYRLK